MTAAETNRLAAEAATILFPIAEAHLKDGEQRACHCPACTAWETLYQSAPDYAEGVARRLNKWEGR